SSRWLTPWLARRRPGAIGEAVFDLYVRDQGLPGSGAARMLDARFGPAREDSVGDAIDVVDAATSSALLDLTDLVDGVLPQMMLRVRTETHLYRFEVGALGLPLGPVQVNRTDAPHARGFKWCAICQTSGDCAHLTDSVRWPVAMTLLLPGLGHLMQGRFGRARTISLFALGYALEALRNFLPRYLGTLPDAPTRYQLPAAVYSALMFIALLDVAFEGMRRSAHE
ncbi:MAG: hypothetical protein ACJ790_06625, partial [Myxococcaceae bacterium]